MFSFGSMAELVRQDIAPEKVFSGSPVYGAWGLVRGCQEVKYVIMTRDITGIFGSDNDVQNEPHVSVTPKYIVYACRVENLRRPTIHPSWRFTDTVTPVAVPGCVWTGIEELSIPDCVRDLCGGCFDGCESLRRVTFGPSSMLERIGASCFEGTRIEDLSIPDCVRDLCNCWFKGCRSLRCVTFGPSSSLERIGVSCFEGSGIEELSIPGSVRDLCDCCFKGCKSLRWVTFGPSSSLERIGASCFEGTGVEDLSIPDCVRDLTSRYLFLCE